MFFKIKRQYIVIRVPNGAILNVMELHLSFTIICKPWMNLSGTAYHVSWKGIMKLYPLVCSNSEIDKVNQSDSMKFCNVLPNQDIISFSRNLTNLSPKDFDLQGRGYRVANKKGAEFSRVFQGFFSINSRDFPGVFALIFSRRSRNFNWGAKLPRDGTKWRQESVAKLN